MFGSFPPSPLVGLRLQSLLAPGSRHCYGIITLVDGKRRSLALAEQWDSAHNRVNPASRLGVIVTGSEHAFAKPYRCRDCGGGEGVRSRRRTWTERYILPLFLMRPVRCAACFRRDYWSIFTPVRDRPQHRDETTRHDHRNAA